MPEDDSYVKCTGATASLCRAFQARDEVCNKRYEYICFFSTTYAEGSSFSGYVVNGSITLPLRDKTERNVFSLFGYPPRSSDSWHLEFILVMVG
jgi:hypothetical protein